MKRYVKPVCEVVMLNAEGSLMANSGNTVPVNPGQGSGEWLAPRHQGTFDDDDNEDYTEE